MLQKTIMILAFAMASTSSLANCPLEAAKEMENSEAALTSYPETVGPVIALKVNKMRCTSCAAKISERFQKVEGIMSVDFDLKGKLVIVSVQKKIQTRPLIEALNELGYPVVGLKEHQDKSDATVTPEEV